MLEPLGVAQGFHVLPRRWVVEHTFARLGRYRRLSKDDERLCATTEALIHIAMSRLMLRTVSHDLEPFQTGSKWDIFVDEQVEEGGLSFAEALLADTSV